LARRAPRHAGARCAAPADARRGLPRRGRLRETVVNLRQVLAHARVQMRFFRRNRLLLGSSLVIVGLMLLSSVPTLLFTSPGQRFSLVTALYGELLGFLKFFAAGLGLLGVSTHLRS